MAVIIPLSSVIHLIWQTGCILCHPAYVGLPAVSSSALAIVMLLSGENNKKKCVLAEYLFYP